MLRGNPHYLLILDSAMVALVLYASAWVYELGNVIFLSLSGASPVLGLQGWVPQGVTVLTSGTDGLASVKILQTGFVVGCVASALEGLRRTRLLLTKVALLTIGGVYLAGLQWEFLSEMPWPTPHHEVVFLALAVALGLSLVALVGKRLNLI